MRYPVITASDLKQHFDSLLARQVEDLRGFAGEQGHGPYFDVISLEKELAPIVATVTDSGISLEDHDQDQIEGTMSIFLFDALSGVPTYVLDDPEFWAYLATGFLWPFVRWREPPEHRDIHRYRLYIDGRSNTECVPLRMFIRARALDRAGVREMAGVIPGAVDFWRSHVIRVRTGSCPKLVRALVKQQASDRMATVPVRAYAKRINRRWSNQILYLMDDAECEKIARLEREEPAPQ